MSYIHPTAIIEPTVELHPSVTVGAYSIIKGAVRVGADTIIHEHSNIQGHTTIGRNCEIGPTAFVGLPAQHLRADRSVGRVVIGDRVIIREMSSIHRSTAAGEEHATRIEAGCLIMSTAHVGHDCVLERDVVAAQGATLGGHCHIGANVFLGGRCGLHQFVRVGRLALIAAQEIITKDAPPFSATLYSSLKGYNAVGCRRAGIGADSLRALRAAFYCLHTHRVRSVALAEIEATVPAAPEVLELLQFIRASKRGILPSLASCRGPVSNRQAEMAELES